jgi:hypothetical protein
MACADRLRNPRQRLREGLARWGQVFMQSYGQAPVLPLLSTALLRNSLFAKIIVVKGKSIFAPEFDQRNTKRNQRTYEQ